MILAALSALGRRAGPVLAAGVFLGVLLPGLAAALKPLLVPSVVAVVTLALLRLDWGAMRAVARRPLLVAAALAWLLLACPLILWAAVALLQPPEALGTALVLKGMTSPVFASVAIALLTGLDAALAVVVTVLAMFLVPLLLPPMALLLLGLELELGLAELMLRLGLLVGGCTALALAVRAAVPAGRLARHAAAIDGLTVLVFLVFAIAIMDGVTELLLERPGYALAVAGAAVAANLGLQALGTLAFWRAGRRAALTVGMCSGNRNLALLMAVLVGGASFDVLAFFAIGQLPIFVLPALLAPVYRRLAGPGP